MSIEHLPVLDIQVIASGRQALGDKFLTLVRFYLEDGATYIHQLRQALVEGDISTIIIKAHNLKSSSGQMGAMRAAEIARGIEQVAKNLQQVGEPIKPAALTTRIRQLEEAFSDAKQALEGMMQNPDPQAD